MTEDRPKKAARGSRASAPPPVHEVIYRRLRDMILFGDLAPGQPVTIQGLSEKLESGVTPIREAIRRLIAEGALEFQGNRRVCVPETTVANIDEFTTARQWLEPHMARIATTRASDADLAALERIDRDLDKAITLGDLRAYLELNHRFHHEIYRLAETPILASMAQGLWLRFGPMMRVVCDRLGAQNLPDRHKEFLRAMALRDAEGAATAISEDVTQGMDQLRKALSGKPLQG